MPACPVTVVTTMLVPGVAPKFSVALPVVAPEPPAMVAVAREPDTVAATPEPAKSISRTYPKPFHVILRDVEEDYGEVNPRTAQRRLKRLVERGHLLRIDLGRRLYAYLRPGSTMVHDADLMREQLDDLVTL